MRKHKGAMVAVAVSAGVVLSACGSDEPRLTKAQFIERGNAICADSKEKIESAAEARFTESGIQPPIPDIVDFALEVVAPTIDNEVERLSELRPPEADEERVEDIIEAGRNGVDTVQRDATIIISSNNDGFNTYQELSSAYGLENCGGGSDATRDALAGISRDA